MNEPMKYNSGPVNNNIPIKGLGYKEIAMNLWKILDEIDTLPDMIHPNNAEGHEKCWKMMVKWSEQRHSYLGSDGYKLTKHK